MIIATTLDTIRTSVFFVLEKEFAEINELKPGDRVHFQILKVVHYKNKETTDLSNSSLVLHYKISKSNKVIINFRIVKSLNLEQYDIISLDLIEPERYKDFHIKD